MIKPVLLAAAALLAAYTVSFLAYALYPRTEPADIAVVFGSRVLEDGTPSPRLRARLRAATLAYEQHLVPRILVSGGRGASGYDEATVMKATLVHAGIPASAVLVDSAGTNTQATVRNAMRVVRDLGLQRVMVVTQYFHVPRCMLAFHKAGVGEVVAAYPAFVEPRDIYSVSREMVALPVQGVVDSGTSKPRS